jgi:signal transduction histidine kinase
MRPADLFRRGSGRVTVIVGLVCFVLGVYVVVVLGGGLLIGRTDSPSPALSVLATAVVALAFAPVQAWLERASSRVGERPATPYDVLTGFSETVSSGGVTTELPARMSRLLAEGTGAAWAQVWLQVADRLTLAGRWPADADDDRSPPTFTSDLVADGQGRRTLAVRHGDEVLGVLRLQERPGLALTSVEERLFTGLAAQAGLVLKLVGLRADLEDRHRDLIARADELTTSRERLIGAQDAERRRLERDIHDGAQQHLVALAVNLRLAQVVATRAPDRARQVLADQVVAARVAIETLSSLSRGIYPRLLSEEGLVPALRAGVAVSMIPVTVEAEAAARPGPTLEAALYFCCMEAVQNAAKHSGASRVTVRLHDDRRGWRLEVTDDGSGFDQARVLAEGAGSGLMNMRDRLDAVGGTLSVVSARGVGTTVTAVVPSAEATPPPPRDLSLAHQEV